MILIASGAYVTSEFQVELGQIPPCLLPIGNKKLIELQHQALTQAFPDQEISISLPESYQISEFESKLLERLKIKAIFIPDSFTLTESLLYIINTDEKIKRNEVFYLLHGDTYISDFSLLKKPDILTISNSSDSYNWEVVHNTIEHALVWSGFFSFSSISFLIKSLTLNKNNFVDAVKYYNERYHLEKIKISNWFDVGHNNTYFSSRANITTQRAFNDLNIKEGVVRKSGQPSIKIQAEAYWFENIPAKLKKYIPVLIEHGEKDCQYFYCLEYLPYMPLNELYVHGKNEILQWNNIFHKLSEYLNISIDPTLNLDDIKKDSQQLYVDKSKKRFCDYIESVKGVNLDNIFIYKNMKLPSLGEILEDCINKTSNLDYVCGILHGDLCFSNILYDSRGDRIKVIDPRGLYYKNEFSIYGDLKYDFAKLTHSVIGLYDFIISGNYKIEETANGSIELIFDIDSRVKSIQESFFDKFKLQKISVTDIMPLVVLLFMSMLPLHADRPDRQKAMFYNALRLYYLHISGNFSIR